MAYFDAPYRPADLTLNSDAINNSCVGFWPLTDGSGTSAVDVSTGGNNATQSGGVSWASTDIGTAASFDGVDDYFNLGTSFWNDNIAGGHDFSINAWFYVDSTSSDSCITGSWGSEKNLIMWVDVGGSSVSLTCIGTDSGFPITSTSAPTVSTGSWHMGTLVADNTAGTATVYLNGVSSNSVSYTASLGTITNPFGLGSDRGVATFRQMSGDIQNVRIFNAALTAAQVEQLYTRPWTGTNYDTEALWLSPPASPVISSASEATSIMTSCIGWWPLTEGSGTTATDLVGSNDGTQSGGVSWASSEIGTVASFDGSNDQFDISHNSSYNAGTTGELTVTAWAKFDTFGTYRVIVSKDYGFNFGAREWLIYGEPSGNRVSAQIFDSSGGAYGVGTGVNTIDTGVWYFLSMVWDGTDLKLFVDGSVASTASAAITPRTSTEDVQIGYNGRFRHDGDVHNVRIFSSALTADQVRLLYERPWIGAAYNETAPLYPPVPSSLTPLDSSSINTDQELWLPLTDGTGTTAVDISGGGNDGTAAGNATFANTSLGTAAAYDGSSSFHWLADSISYSNDLTVSCWMRADGTGVEQPAFCKGRSNNCTWWLGANSSNGIRFATKKGGSLLRIDHSVSSISDWHHLVLVQQAASPGIQAFVNGVSVYSGGSTGTLNSNSYIPIIGAATLSTSTPPSSTEDFEGNVANVRLWSRALSASEVADIYYSPWLGSAYPSTGGGTPSYFVAAQFNRLGIGPRFRRL